MRPIGSSQRWHVARWAAALIAVLGVLGACSRGPSPGEQEEVRTEERKVPEAVRAGAARIGGILGEGVHCGAWYWDREDEDWECTLLGLSRKAELDLGTDGRFHELELVHLLAEVEPVLPEIGRWIREKCHDAPDPLIELSLRREVLLDPVPALSEAWSQSGVVLEIQCPRGHDFELDARGLVQDRAGDDRRDPSADDPEN